MSVNISERQRTSVNSNVGVVPKSVCRLCHPDTDNQCARNGAHLSYFDRWAFECDTGYSPPSFSSVSASRLRGRVSLSSSTLCTRENNTESAIIAGNGLATCVFRIPHSANEWLRTWRWVWPSQ